MGASSISGGIVVFHSSHTVASSFATNVSRDGSFLQALLPSLSRPSSYATQTLPCHSRRISKDVQIASNLPAQPLERTRIILNFFLPPTLKKQNDQNAKGEFSCSSR